MNFESFCDQMGIRHEPWQSSLASVLIIDEETVMKTGNEDPTVRQYGVTRTSITRRLTHYVRNVGGRTFAGNARPERAPSLYTSDIFLALRMTREEAFETALHAIKANESGVEVVRFVETPGQAERRVRIPVADVLMYESGRYAVADDGRNGNFALFGDLYRTPWRADLEEAHLFNTYADVMEAIAQHGQDSKYTGFVRGFHFVGVKIEPAQPGKIDVEVVA